MEHLLKIQDRFYRQIESGEKTFEIRFNDRGFQRGDTIKFNREWTKGLYKEEQTEFEILNVFQEKGFGLEEGYCILSFKLI